MRVFLAHGSKAVKRKKRTEFLKTVFIFVLLFVFVFLGYKIIKTKRLISPEALRADSASGESGAITNNEDAINLYFEYTSPDYIMLSREGAREVFYCDSEYYQKAEKIIKEANKSIFMPDAEITEVEDEKAMSSLIALNSLCASYTYRRYPKYSIQFLSGGDNKISNNIQTYKKMIVVPGEKEKDSLSVYITDEKTEKTFKVSTSVSSAALMRLMNVVKEDGAKKYSYAYELNFGKEPKNSGGIKTVGMNPDILIPLVKISKPEAEVRVPSVFGRGMGGSSGGELVAEIAQTFGMNMGSLRQYIDKENTVVCVSEAATLKIYSNGVVEYNAAPLKGGINLAGGTKLNSGNSYFYSFTGVARIINALSKLARNDDSLVKIRLSDLQSESTEVAEYKFIYDWYLDGVKVLSRPYHGVEATVSEGRLSYMRMNIKQFDTGYRQIETEPLLSAIDRYFAERPEDSRRSITDCRLVYPLEEGTESMQAKWNVY